MDPLNYQPKTDEQKQPEFAPFWTFIGLYSTPVAVILGVVSAGGGYGDYAFAKLLFPYAMISASYNGSIGAAEMLCAVLQFTIYGLIIDVLKGRGLRGFALLLPVVHAIATAISFQSNHF